MITAEDRQKFSNYSDSAILGIKLISGLTDEAIRKGINDIGRDIIFESSIIVAILFLMDIRRETGEHPKTNPLWVAGRIIDEALERDLINSVDASKLREIF